MHHRLVCRIRSFQRTPGSIRDWRTWKRRRLHGITGWYWQFRLTRLPLAGWPVVAYLLLPMSTLWNVDIGSGVVFPRETRFRTTTQKWLKIGSSNVVHWSWCGCDFWSRRSKVKVARAVPCDVSETWLVIIRQMKMMMMMMMIVTFLWCHGRTFRGVPAHLMSVECLADHKRFQSSFKSSKCITASHSSWKRIPGGWSCAELNTLGESCAGKWQ